MIDVPPKRNFRGRSFVIAADRVILGVARHWLLVFNLVIFTYVGLPVLAPVLMNAGLTTPARAIYGFYGGVCHQLGYRSWFLFGEHATYPRADFEHVTGVNPDDLVAAKEFTGNATLGYKVAFCERDAAIYAAMLVLGLLYAVPAVRARLRPLAWPVYLLVGLAPIGLDGFSQLLSQYPFNLVPPFAWLPYRESTALLRTITGGLFGLANAWLALPYLRETMDSVRSELGAKLARVT